METHCRLCLKDFEQESNGEWESHSIYDQMYDDRTLQQVLAECFQLKFPSVEIATKVCSACYTDMQQVWQIRQRVLACDDTIRNISNLPEAENATENESLGSKAPTLFEEYLQDEEATNMPYVKPLHTVYVTLPPQESSSDTMEIIEHDLSPKSPVTDVNPMMDPVTEMLIASSIEDAQPTDGASGIEKETTKVKKPVGRPRLHAQRPQRGRYFCYICSTKLPDLTAFDDHLMDHASIMELLCPLCNETAPTIRRLNTHIKQHDYDRETFLCMQCGKTFTSAACLKRHEHTIHRGENLNSSGQFSCKYCEKQVKSLWFLQVHENTHTREIRYRCKRCDKEFSNRSSLIRHELIHSDSLPYKCTACDAEFRQHSNLRVHMAIHMTKKTIECSQCEKRFVSQKKLSQHSISCHPEVAKTPVQCYFCPTNFKKKLYLKAHLLKAHPEEQLPLVSCDVCDRQFLTQHDVNKHKKTHQ